MRSTRPLAALVVALLGVPAAAGQPSDPLVPSLIVEAPESLAADAARIRALDTREFVPFARLLGLEHAGEPIRVVLAAEDSHPGRATPAWVAGFAYAGAGVVVLFPSRSPSYPYQTLDDVLRHEVAHVLIARAAAGADVPRWFHEGLAMSVERGWGLADRTRVAAAMLSGRPSLARLETDFYAGATRAARAYAVSAAFVRHVTSRHGAGAPGRVLREVARGVPFESAFATAVGLPLAEVERQFWRGRWWYQVVPFLTSSLALWMGIVLLALVAIRRHARHRAERRRRWDDEDGEPISDPADATETNRLRGLASDAPAPSQETGTDARPLAFRPSAPREASVRDGEASRSRDTE